MLRRRLFHLALAATSIVLLAVVPGLIKRRPLASQPSSFAQPTPADPTAEKGVPLPLRFLVIGLDASLRRSDVLLAVTIPQEGPIVVLSIPRDTRVPSANGRYRKINEVYGVGGAQATQEAVAQLLGTDFPHYLTLDYASFEHLVDALGGVPLFVEQRLHYIDRAGDLYIDIQPGYQTLSGTKALHFVRYRSDGRGDIGRIGRQQEFMRAWARSVIANPARLHSLGQELPQGIRTNLPVADALRLAVRLATEQRSLHFDILPGEPAYIENVSYWLPRHPYNP